MIYLGWFVYDVLYILPPIYSFNRLHLIVLLTKETEYKDDGGSSPGASGIVIIEC